jgi:hypothetical protein
MTPYPLTMQLGMKRCHGHFFITPNKLYFVSQKAGGEEYGKTWVGFAREVTNGRQP